MIIDYQAVQNTDNSSLKPAVSRRSHKRLINGRAGFYHYKLLSYLSQKLENALIVELGTHHGTSSLAMSLNPGNQIRTYDVVDSYTVTQQPKNVERVLGNIFEMGEQEWLLKADMIFVDTFHMGEFEWQVHSYLLENNYKGFVVYDDIHWSKEMIEFWGKINTPEKFDLTDIGHGGQLGPNGQPAGTGLVDFSGQVKIEKNWHPGGLGGLIAKARESLRL